MSTRLILIAIALMTPTLLVRVPSAQSSQLEEETMRHFQALLQIDTSDPPGNEAPAVEYLKGVLEREGIEVKVFASDPKRPSLVARLRGNGKKRPILMMGHTDVVNVDPAKWTHPPFSATRVDGYVYGRGTLDDKDNVVASLMTIIQLKRAKVQLDRDVIFLAEPGEESGGRVGIDYMVKEHWPEIEAEYCLAEGGNVPRTAGRIEYAGVATTEKVSRGVRLIARGPSGHGSVPLRTNAVAHLARAVARVSEWQTPMRLNETTKAFFERMAAISSPADAARFRAIVEGKDTAGVEEYFAINQPRFNSTLRTSISPNIIKGGYRSNVIPSEAEATLDIRALPDEDMTKLLDEMRRVINDPQVEIVRSSASVRPAPAPSRLDTEAFRVLEQTVKSVYGAVTLPVMLTGATDMSFLRAKGVQCYGIGPVVDSEDGPKGFGSHSDQERILEEALHKFVRFNYEVVRSLAAAK